MADFVKLEDVDAAVVLACRNAGDELERASRRETEGVPVTQPVIDFGGEKSTFRSQIEQNGVRVTVTVTLVPPEAEATAEPEPKPKSKSAAKRIAVQKAAAEK